MQGFGQKIGDDFYRKKDAEKFGFLRNFVILNNICCILLEMGFGRTEAIVEHRYMHKKNRASLLGSFLPRSPLLVIYEQLFQFLPHSLFVRLDSRLFLFG